MPTRAERLRAAFDQACEEHEIRGELQGGPEQLRPVFHPQEGADSQLLERGFRDEMAKTGMDADVALAAGELDEATVSQATAALRTAIARMRVLLIEFNSYLSGGIDWVFPGAREELARRGLAKYRFPVQAPVEVVAEGDHMRISVAQGDLGKTTSSGFYVPTRVRGDFAATLRYRLEDWHPGEHSVSIALFAQDEPSRLRYYSQRRSAGERQHEALANFSNTVLTTPVALTEPDGRFRLERRGDVVVASHCENDTWTVLGEHRGDPTEDVILGSKIWSSGLGGPFEARLFELTIEGELPQDQLPPVPVRPDPRTTK